MSEEPRRGWLAEMGQTLREAIKHIEWPVVLMFGTAAGVLMPVAFLQTSFVMFLAGIVPVGSGLLIGRRVKSYYTFNGFVAGIIGAIVSVIVLYLALMVLPFGANYSQALLQDGALPEQATPAALFMQFAVSTVFFLITFVAFGASTSGRSEERNREAQAIVDARGGRLERPNAIRTADDIRGLSLPQFGSYVNTLFKKKGFKFKDYRFVDKDKHLDFWMEYEGEPWRLRLAVLDKVNPGTIEGLYQEMKQENIQKGVVLTSTDFTPSAAKAAKNRPIVLINGETLYEIAEQ